jgi:hypothetical protein
MKEQLDLFDAKGGIADRDEAIERVNANADPEWKRHANIIVRELAQTRQPFTTDAVWRELIVRGIEGPHEPRAMGAIMIKLQKIGVIKALEDHRPSAWRLCHRRPKQLWIGI